MTKLRLPAHLLELNPDVPELVELPGKKKAEDKKHLFSDAWAKYGDGDECEPEYRFAPPRRYRADFRVGTVLVEVDGGDHMVRYNKNGKPVAVGRHTMDADKAKLNLATSLGFRVLRFSPTMLIDDPIGCVELVIITQNL